VLPSSRVSIVVPSVVPKSTASDGVHNDEEYEKNNVDNSHLLPIPPEVVQQSSFARVAVKAENICLIIPCITVRIGGGICRRLLPVNR
jgi:hypothetical protein